jgi:hypothetical protein
MKGRRGARFLSKARFSGVFLRMSCSRLWLAALLLSDPVHAGVGDPQLRTDHPWYPGELALSTFDRLFATQAEHYERATGVKPESAEDRALASWFFRNTHYAHGEEGREDLWGEGFSNDAKSTTREYWTGLFAHGFGLCGTTHAQWTAELDALLGPGHSRVTGTRGHNAFEVFLTGGPYGSMGRWALLDHDLSTVIFDPRGGGLLGLDEIYKDWKPLSTRAPGAPHQRGWLVCGLHPGDGASYAAYQTIEYRAGYAGPPPVVHLRQGETLRRWFEPGLEEGRTHVFWGRNYRTGGVPGLERSRTWVNQPEAMHGTTKGTDHVNGQARYGNAVYEWRPDFAGGGYREGVVDEGPDHVTLEFCTPYIIGATPPDDSPWGVYQPGGKNGLILRGRARGAVLVSTDGGASWQAAGEFRDGLDLTDFVKGRRQYHLRLGAGAAALAGSGLVIRTVCQANPAVFPRLKDGGTQITLGVGGRGLVSYGPGKALAAPRVVEGGFDTPRVTLELQTPRGLPALALHAAAHVASSNPPDPAVRYQIEYSLDGGTSWRSLLKDGNLERRGMEPGDFWSQSLWAAGTDLPEGTGDTVRVRFHNSGGKRCLRAEGHLLYPVPGRRVRVAYAWTDRDGTHEASRVLEDGQSWTLPTGQEVRTHWVELAAE